MRYSISHLLIGTLVLAVAIGIGYPLLKFSLYDNVNFTYDRDQTVEYIETTTSGLVREKLRDAIRQLSVLDDDKMIVADASVSGTELHVELISTTFDQLEFLDIKLGSDETISLDSYELKSTGTYYFYGIIPLTDKIPDGAKIVSIHFRDGESKSNEYVITNPRNGG